MKPSFSFFIVLLSLVEPIHADAQSATIYGNCYSISVGPLTASVPGSGNVKTYLTTFDGSTGFPLTEKLGNLSYVSQEFRPKPGAPGVFQADYISYTSTGLMEYGYFEVMFPNADTDGNGLQDIFQKDKPGNFSFSGTAHSDSPRALDYSLSGQIALPIRPRAPLLLRVHQA